LEAFFPKTIDKLNKERSNLDGPKPIVINSGNLDLLFLILTGEEYFKEKKE
jgi:hypothetical protein